MHRSGDVTAAKDKIFAGVGADIHNGSSTEKTAEINAVADFFAVSGDKAGRRRFRVYNTDGDLIRDNAADRFHGCVAGDGYHIKTDGANRCHSFELCECERAAFGSFDHTLILGNGDECAGKTADVR